jgi:hypothetical protein
MKKDLLLTPLEELPLKIQTFRNAPNQHPDPHKFLKV